MKPEKLVEHLEEAVRKLGYTIRLEKGDFRGGKCIFADQQLVFVNKRMGFEERAEILARVLAISDYDVVFMLPEVRSYVEKFMATYQTQIESAESAAQG